MAGGGAADEIEIGRKKKNDGVFVFLRETTGFFVENLEGFGLAIVGGGGDFAVIVF